MQNNTDKISQTDVQKAKIRQRYRQGFQGNVTVIPAKQTADLYQDSTPKRVAIYARVSTYNVNQTSSYELQKNFYENLVRRNPSWKLYKIYADEGISGTSLNHREAFKQMIADCHAGKIDLIITKTVPRFARNVENCIHYARELKHLKPPVGILFETEGIYTLREDSEMQLALFIRPEPEKAILPLRLLPRIRTNNSCGYHQTNTFSVCRRRACRTSRGNHIKIFCITLINGCFGISIFWRDSRIISFWMNFTGRELSCGGWE